MCWVRPPTSLRLLAPCPVHTSPRWRHSPAPEEGVSTPILRGRKLRLADSRLPKGRDYKHRRWDFRHLELPISLPGLLWLLIPITGGRGFTPHHPPSSNFLLVSLLSSRHLGSHLPRPPTLSSLVSASSHFCPFLLTSHPCRRPSSA